MLLLLQFFCPTEVNPKGKSLALGKDRLTSQPFIHGKLAQRRMAIPNGERREANKPPKYSGHALLDVGAD